MPLHDISYKHWQGKHLSVWGRRRVIAQNGLTACLQIRFMTILVVLCWAFSLLPIALLFIIGQLLVPDSIIVRWASFNSGLQTMADMLTIWLRENPDISVGVTQNIIFYTFGLWLMQASTFALGAVIPLLITRDLASNAIVIYSSKAVTRGDYLIGKFAAAFGFLALTWLGPICTAWFLGNLLSPDWKFFWHSRGVIENILIYGLSSMAALSVLALGISALTKKQVANVAIWYAWWILGVILMPVALITESWLLHVSFGFNLNQIALYTFRVGDKVTTATESIPALDTALQAPGWQNFLKSYTTPHIAGTLFTLLVMMSLSAWIVNKRVKPE